MKQAYLAGPDVFAIDAQEIYRHKKALLEKKNFGGISPLDNDLHMQHLRKAMSGHEAAQKVFEENKEAMQEADLCLANATPFPGIDIDTGTAFEIGFMHALGKPVFVYSNTDGYFESRHIEHVEGKVFVDRRNQIRRKEDDMAIEKFQQIDNLMITRCAQSVHVHGGPPSLINRLGLNREPSALSSISALGQFWSAVQSAEEFYSNNDTE